MFLGLILNVAAISPAVMEATKTARTIMGIGGLGGVGLKVLGPQVGLDDSAHKGGPLGTITTIAEWATLGIYLGAFFCPQLLLVGAAASVITGALSMLTGLLSGSVNGMMNGFISGALHMVCAFLPGWGAMKAGGPIRTAWKAAWTTAEKVGEKGICAWFARLWGTTGKTLPTFIEHSYGKAAAIAFNEGKALSKVAATEGGGFINGAKAYWNSPAWKMGAQELASASTATTTVAGRTAQGTRFITQEATVVNELGQTQVVGHAVYDTTKFGRAAVSYNPVHVPAPPLKVGASLKELIAHAKKWGTGSLSPRDLGRLIEAQGTLGGVQPLFSGAGI